MEKLFLSRDILHAARLVEPVEPVVRYGRFDVVVG